MKDRVVHFMFGYLGEPAWSPYIAGAGIGILACLTFLLSDRPLGCSTGYAKMSGLVTRLFAKDRVEQDPFYQTVVPAFDWQFMIIPGIVIGAFLASALSGTFAIFIVPPLWASAFGTGTALRIAVAVLGGILLAVGARWAGGCTIGHGISGTMQLAVSGIVSTTCFFIGGILTAYILFRVIGA